MKPMYEVIKDALVERGWKIDPTARENLIGELHEFIHPKRGKDGRHKRMAFVDALLAQMDLEEGEA